jgi:hypothetical protein
MDHFLNFFFFTFHSLWMLFNCVGWIWKRTRPWHLLTILLTAASWLLVAWWLGYDWGYCLCTDWHWRVRDRLGYHNDPSYTQQMVRSFTSLEVPRTLADGVTLGIMVVVTLLTLVLNLRDFLCWWRKKVVPAGTPAASSEPP